MARVKRGVEEVVDPAGVEVAPTFEDVYAATRPGTVRTAFLIVGSRAVDPPPVGDAEIDVVWDAMARLRPERRAALVLRFYEDLTHEDIARAMGCRVSTARTRVHRALADVRKELER